jgi:hypothetical protein
VLDPDVILINVIDPDVIGTDLILLTGTRLQANGADRSSGG